MEQKMTPEQKREKKFEQWLNPQNVTFKDDKAKQDYQTRVGRFIKVIKLEKPDRVPYILPAGTFPLYYSGMTLKEAMHDPERAVQAYRRFFNEFESDVFSGGMAGSARASEILNPLNMKWPGHGLPDDASMHQFVEGEYMKEDEYDMFLDDLSDWCFRRYLPRSIGALAPFAEFQPIPYMLGMANRFVGPAVMPHVRAAYQAIIDYGLETEKSMGPAMKFGQEVRAAGYPSFFGGQSHAPFDILADTLRGTKGILLDIYRQPEKVLQAMHKIVKMNIDVGLDGIKMSGVPIVFFALHKGDDTFMSSKQYEKFYWPTFREVILGLIEQGAVPLLFAEGAYNNRLEIIKDLPRGKVIWYFDRTDMFRAKKILGDTACLSGNIPASLMITGTPKEVKEYCRRLIEVCGEGGGFILTGGASIDKGNPDNLRAMTEAVMEYGVY